MPIIHRVTLHGRVQASYQPTAAVLYRESSRATNHWGSSCSAAVSDSAAAAKRHACCVAAAHHRCCASQSQMTSPASQPPASWQMYRRMAGRSVALSTACTPASMGCTMKGMAAAWGGVDRARRA